MYFWSELETPLGVLTVVASRGGLTQVLLPEQPAPLLVGLSLSPQSRQMAPYCEQLQAYFAGTLQRFDLPLVLDCTPFQRQVYAALQEIPFGETRAYRQVADALGRPKSSRAVGAANGKNPLPIVIPCHRVIAADGSLGGYSGGLAVKRWLLAHEQQASIDRPGELFQ